MNNSFQSISTTIEIADLHLNVSQRISVFGANIKVNSFQQNLWRDWNFQTLDVGVFWATFLEHVGVCQAPKHANGAATIPPGDTPPLKWFCNSWVCRFTKPRKSCHKEYQRPQSRWCDKRDKPMGFSTICTYVSYVFITGMGFSPRISPSFRGFFPRPQCFRKLHLSMAYLVLLDLVRHRLSPHLSAMVPIFHPKAGETAADFLWVSEWRDFPKEILRNVYKKKPHTYRYNFSIIYRFNYGWLWKYYNINDMRYV